MGAPAAKLVTPAPSFDFSKPVPLAWWKLARGNFVGISNLELVQVPPVRSRVHDGVDIDGPVDSSALHPNGMVVVSVRCGVTGAKPEGTIRDLIFSSAGGQGAALWGNDR